MRRAVFITGMPGAGKTFVGRKVASAFHLPFFDTDEYIEAFHRKTITDIFTEFGETGFRKMETDALRKIVAQHPSPVIVSCGGGLPSEPSNLFFMKEHGCIVYLEAGIETLLKNLKNQAAQRPLLSGNEDELYQKLSMLYQKRKMVYEKADYIVAVETLSIPDFEPILQACIKQH